MILTFKPKSFFFWLQWIFLAARGLSFTVACRLLIVVASLFVEHGLQAQGIQQLRRSGSAVVVHGIWSLDSAAGLHGLSYLTACGIFPDQGSNPGPLHWQANLIHCTTREVLNPKSLVKAWETAVSSPSGSMREPGNRRLGVLTKGTQ